MGCGCGIVSVLHHAVCTLPAGICAGKASTADTGETTFFKSMNCVAITYACSGNAFLQSFMYPKVFLEFLEI